MADLLLLDPELEDALRRAGLADAEALFRLGGSHAETSVVCEVGLDVPGTSGRFHLKRYHYPGWKKAQGLLGRGTLWGRAPEVQEYHALAWLRAHHIPAARPIAAASRQRAGRLETHALLTEHVPGTRDLSQRLRDPEERLTTDRDARQDVFDRLARLLRRMHDLGFVHRDCHARNVLIDADGDVPRLFLIDCRRGGLASRRHGPLMDLATLDLDGEVLATQTERWRFLRAWSGEAQVARTVYAEIVKRRERLRREMHRRGRSLR